VAARTAALGVCRRVLVHNIPGGATMVQTAWSSAVAPIRWQRQRGGEEVAGAVRPGLLIAARGGNQPVGGAVTKQRTTRRRFGGRTKLGCRLGWVHGSAAGPTH
jgi:hypothetical protein